MARCVSILGVESQGQRFHGRKVTLLQFDPFDLVAIQTILRKGGWELEMQYILYSDFKALEKNIYGAGGDVIIRD